MGSKTDQGVLVSAPWTFGKGWINTRQVQARVIIIPKGDDGGRLFFSSLIWFTAEAKVVVLSSSYQAPTVGGTLSITQVVAHPPDPADPVVSVLRKTLTMFPDEWAQTTDQGTTISLWDSMRYRVLHIVVGATSGAADQKKIARRLKKTTDQINTHT